MTSPASTLYIDDELHLLPGLREALEDEGLSLDFAETWTAGMELFQVIGHELVVADYDLREAKTGLHLLAEIKQLAPSTRLILISGRIPQSASGEVATAPGVDLYLQRTDPTLLATIIAEAQSADARAKGSDWQAVGRAYPDARAVDMTEVKKIEDQLRSRLGTA